MAIDLEAIRKKIKKLNGERTSNAEFWHPAVGEYKIRILPWKNATEGSPFIERWFNYIPKTVLAPYQFGKSDPIEDLRRKLFSTNDPNDKILAKKLMPRLRVFAPVVVRGQEQTGVQLWSFNKGIYQKLLGYFLNEDVGDITDPTDGFDINVRVTQTPGKQFQDIDVEAARRPRKLSDDPEQAKKWLDSIPDLDQIYTLRSYEEITSLLNAWLAGDTTETPATPASDEGTQRGGSNQSASDALDELVDGVKPTKKVEKIEKPVAAKSAKKEKVIVEDDDLPAPQSSSLDDAFSALMEEDD